MLAIYNEERFSGHAPLHEWNRINSSVSIKMLTTAIPDAEDEIAKIGSSKASRSNDIDVPMRDDFREPSNDEPAIV